MQIVSSGDNLHEMSKPILQEKWEKYLKMLSAGIFTQRVVKASDTSTHMGHFVLSPTKRKKRERRASREKKPEIKEEEGQEKRKIKEEEGQKKREIKEEEGQEKKEIKEEKGQKKREIKKEEGQGKKGT